jgi:GDP-mannose 6-dehydrogenase
MGDFPIALTVPQSLSSWKFVGAVSNFSAAIPRFWSKILGVVVPSGSITQGGARCMNLNIYGMGYVGCVSAACLANLGHHVTGIDIDDIKLRILQDGRSPIVEEGLPEVIRKASNSGTLQAMRHGIHPADASIICVGTPSSSNGSLQLEYVLKVVEQIGDYLRDSESYHVVVVRSTVLPGTVEDVIIPRLERRSRKRAGSDFGVCMNPEFMREGTSIEDFYRPVFTLIGELDRKSGDVVEDIYRSIGSPVIRTEIKVAEMIKYTSNSFHALKVTFANEIGNICKQLNIDSHEVMKIFCRDTQLNISSSYFKPGFAFGGSCLPKDLRAILHKASQLDIESPLLKSILVSNTQQIERAFELIKKIGKTKIGVLGLSFKAGTDDLRESPIVELIEKLIGKGYTIQIYDREVAFARLFGANKRYIEQTIPHISCLMKESVQQVIDESDLVIVSKKDHEFVEKVMSMDGDKAVIDLVRILPDQARYGGNYEGICW